GTGAASLTDVTKYGVGGLVAATESRGPDGTADLTSKLLARSEFEYDELGRTIRTYGLLETNTSVLSDERTHTSTDPVVQTWYTRAGQARQIKDAENR